MKKIIILLTAIGLFSGCYEDFLERNPQGMADFETIFKSEDQSELALWGVYDMMQGLNSYERNFYIYGDIMSDDTEEGGSSGCSDRANYRPFQRYVMTSSELYLSGFYRNMYVGIQRANSIINYAQPNSQKMAQIIAEAKVLRSLFYFDLVRVFGPVIYIDSPINFTEASALSNRQVEGDDAEGTLQVKMIYDEIVNTIEEAIPDLLEENQGLLTVNSAKGLLCKVLMYRKNDGDYDKALQIVNEMYEEKGDPSVKYADIYAEQFELGGEALIEVQFINSTGYNKNADGEGTIRPIDQTARYLKEFRGGQWVPETRQYEFYGLNTPTQDLFNAFEIDVDNKEYDPRLDMIAKGEDALWTGSPCDSMIYQPAGDYGLGSNKIAYYQIYTGASATGYYHRKAEPRRGNVEFTENEQAAGVNHILLRYADVLLLGAEAAFYTGDKQLALKYVNAIRTRARNSKITDRNLETGEYSYDEPSTIPVDLTLDQLTLEEIQNERRRELFCEGERFFDLVRWGIQNEVLGNIKADACGVSVNWKEYNKVLPFHRDQIEQHGGNLVQNPGYN